MAGKFINKADISDVLIERPVSFAIKREHYSVYPATLGKIQLNARLIEAMGLDKTPAKDIYHLAFLVAEEHRDKCLRLIAYATLPGADCLDENKVQDRLNEIHDIERKDIASLLVIILSQDKTQAIEKHFGIDREREKFSAVIKVKSQDKNSPTFGGKTLWGGLIDAACERYGWSYQYVLWGISYSNLQLLFADQVRQVFLTEEERKKAHIPTDGITINASDSASLNQFIKTQSWR